MLIYFPPPLLLCPVISLLEASVAELSYIVFLFSFSLEIKHNATSFPSDFCLNNCRKYQTIGNCHNFMKVIQIVTVINLNCLIYK